MAIMGQARTKAAHRREAGAFCGRRSRRRTAQGARRSLAAERGGANGKAAVNVKRQDGRQSPDTPRPAFRP
jgi:hypothetical protein